MIILLSQRTTLSGARNNHCKGMMTEAKAEADIEQIATLYMNYYNNYEGGCWTYEKAYKRIHQMVTIEDSLCLIQWDDARNVTGFVSGFFKEFDDLVAYYLEEIVVLAEYQNKGYGTAFLHEIERQAVEHGAEHIELTSVNDKQHRHFYTQFGMYTATNLMVMGKHFA